MKKVLFVLAAVGVAFAAAFIVASNHQASLNEAHLAEKAAWDAEKAQLEAALQKAPRQPASVERIVTVDQTKKLNPKEIIEKLRAGKSVVNPSRRIQFAIHQFETLIEIGPEALPAIREFLAQNQDVDYDFGGNRLGKNSKVPTDFLVPPSLRFGLFDVLKQIGGEAAEKILADVLRTTGRGLEVAYLARTLQELAPNRYRDLALSVAHDLLAHLATATDKYESDYLYGVLSMYNDGSLLGQAQNQLIHDDGKIDKAALKYLQSTLGERAVGVAANAYNDARVNPVDKEPLARVALYFAGSDPQANDMFNTFINDSALPLDVRRELAEDLNQDGFVNEKHPTAADQKLIAARLKLIDKYLGVITEPRVLAGFREAQKDLLDMQKQ